jgi:hypothetical protein
MAWVCGVVRVAGRVAPKKNNVHILIPESPECYLIQEESTCKYNKVKDVQMKGSSQIIQ